MSLLIVFLWLNFVFFAVFVNDIGVVELRFQRRLYAVDILAANCGLLGFFFVGKPFDFGFFAR